MCKCKANKKKTSAADLAEAVKEFAQTYWTVGSGIVAIEKTEHGISVSVRSTHAAKSLPVIFKRPGKADVEVTVFQDLGQPVGKKLIVRDSQGNIIGSQG